MKKMISLLAAVSLLCMAIPVNAEVLNGEAEQKIEVKGTLGEDNTDSEAEINEGSEDWINVTVPTATIFYSVGTAENSTIKSPNYEIINHSGRPVNIYYGGLVGNNTDDISYDLELIGLGSDAFKLREDKSITSVSEVDPSENKLTTLANNKDQSSKNDESVNEPKDLTKNVAVFSYGGVVKEVIPSTVEHNYTMTLRFETISAEEWNKTTEQVVE